MSFVCSTVILLNLLYTGPCRWAVQFPPESSGRLQSLVATLGTFAIATTTTILPAQDSYPLNRSLLFGRNLKPILQLAQGDGVCKRRRGQNERCGSDNRPGVCFLVRVTQSLHNVTQRARRKRSFARPGAAGNSVFNSMPTN